ncbi:MAG: YicC/YloC family endoribonuclease [Pseudomonadota bacterium]|nr:YicC/YloC family endoribonuclease [Pseudomonadota bacterium]
MTKSMTAFARETDTGDAGELTWELRSVNHRFLEPFVRLPEDLRGLEPAVRERVSSHLRRGKVDCSLRYVPAPGVGGNLRVNRSYLEQLLAAGGEVGALVGRPAEPDPFDLLRWPGVLQEQELDLGPVKERALGLLDKALRSMIATRGREGERLASLIRERCDKLAACVAGVRERMPQVMTEVRRRILDRLAEVRAELDPSRLEQELALLAQRLDVDEEMDRMGAHVQEVRTVLQSDEPVGRRLDFLMQELNREANTLGSKSADVEVTRLAVDMKVLIEQMREQVQNIE